MNLFKDLMRKYHLNKLISLDGIHKDHNKQCKQLTVYDFKNESKQLIYNTYKIDFDTFQYSNL